MPERSDVYPAHLLESLAYQMSDITWARLLWSLEHRTVVANLLVKQFSASIAQEIFTQVSLRALHTSISELQKSLLAYLRSDVNIDAMLGYEGFFDVDQVPPGFDTSKIFSAVSLAVSFRDLLRKSYPSLFGLLLHSYGFSAVLSILSVPRAELPLIYRAHLDFIRQNFNYTNCEPLRLAITKAIKEVVANEYSGNKMEALHRACTFAKVYPLNQLCKSLAMIIDGMKHELKPFLFLKLIHKHRNKQRGNGLPNTCSGEENEDVFGTNFRESVHHQFNGKNAPTGAHGSIQLHPNQGEPSQAVPLDQELPLRSLLSPQSIPELTANESDFGTSDNQLAKLKSQKNHVTPKWLKLNQCLNMGAEEQLDSSANTLDQHLLSAHDLLHDQVTEGVVEPFWGRESGSEKSCSEAETLEDKGERIEKESNYLRRGQKALKILRRARRMLDRNPAEDPMKSSILDANAAVPIPASRRKRILDNRASNERAASPISDSSCSITKRRRRAKVTLTELSDPDGAECPKVSPITNRKHDSKRRVSGRFSVQEDEWLLEGLEKYGWGSWAIISNNFGDGKAAGTRGAVSLKDRARSMGLNFEAYQRPNGRLERRGRQRATTPVQGKGSDKKEGRNGMEIEAIGQDGR